MYTGALYLAFSALITVAVLSGEQAALDTDPRWYLTIMLLSLMLVYLLVIEYLQWRTKREIAEESELSGTVVVHGERNGQHEHGAAGEA